ncbi:MAG: hypothetical protein WAV18_09600 [Roseiarcus sp.]
MAPLACSSRTTSSVASSGPLSFHERKTKAPRMIGDMRRTLALALDDLAEIVRARLDDRRLGFGHKGFEAFPAERAFHGGDLIPPGLPGGDEALDLTTPSRPSLRLRIPTKPATNSNKKPATDSDLNPAGIPI